LSLSDLSGVPTTFITEIQQDEVYETIYHELQKKLPHNNLPTSPRTLLNLPEQDQRKSLSPRLLTMEDDDDIIDNDASVTDDMSSSVSSENNASSSQDGYDTDIETGKFLCRINDLIRKKTNLLIF